MSGKAKPTLALYWAAGCGGCDVAFLNLGEKILDVASVFEIVFWPCVADFKTADLIGLADGSIDLCLLNGAIRNEENEEMAHLLRRKSRVLVAFGSCAQEGCIPALANLATSEALLESAYHFGPSARRLMRDIPARRSEVPSGELTLPALLESVKTVDQVTEVDCAIPGCPPEPRQIWAAIERLASALVGGAPLPPAGAVLGASETTVCEECSLPTSGARILRFLRPHEGVPREDACLVEQGHVCLGMATRGGCGALCPRVGMGCRGCYGPPDGVVDQGAKALSAIASSCGVVTPVQGEQALLREAEPLLGGLADPAGTFYRFGLARSLLRGGRGAAAGGSGDGP